VIRSATTAFTAWNPPIVPPVPRAPGRRVVRVSCVRSGRPRPAGASFPVSVSVRLRAASAPLGCRAAPVPGCVWLAVRAEGPGLASLSPHGPQW